RRQRSAHIPALLFIHIIKECPEFAGTRGMSELAQSLRFNLTNALAGNAEQLANFFQRPLRAALHTKAHPDDLLFPRTERSQHMRSPVLTVRVDDRFGG